MLEFYIAYFLIELITKREESGEPASHGNDADKHGLGGAGTKERAHKFNTRPRKRLGFQTPLECYEESL